MGVPGSEGGDDFLDDGNGEDGDDFIEAQGEEVPRAKPQPTPPPSSTSNGAPAPSSSSGPRRRIRIKPMPASLVERWPKVVSMFIVMNDGTQLLLVKG